MFRHRLNLVKHWRTACPEIQVGLSYSFSLLSTIMIVTMNSRVFQANLPDGVELILDDSQLRDMVSEFILKAVTNPIEDIDINAASVRTGIYLLLFLCRIFKYWVLGPVAPSFREENQVRRVIIFLLPLRRRLPFLFHPWSFRRV